MTTTINNYKVGLGLDVRQFIDSARLSREEFRLLKKDIENIRTPLEEYTLATDRLTDAWVKTNMPLEVFERLWAEEERKLREATEAANKHNNALKQTPLTLDQIISKWVTIGVVIAGARRAFDSVINTFKDLRQLQLSLDDTVDAAERLALTFNELQGLRYAGDLLGGATADAVDTAIKKMQINIASAVAGEGGASLNAAFERLGVDATEAMLKGPVWALAKIADGYAKIETQAERLNITNEIFGKGGAEIVSMLKSGGDAISRAVEHQNELNGLTQVQAEQIAQMNDRWKELEMAAKGHATTLAAELAPSMKAIADDVMRWLGYAKDMKELYRDIGDTLAFSYGMIIDIGEATAGFANPVKSGIEWGAGIKGSDGAYTMDNAFRMMMEVGRERKRLEEESREKERKLLEDRKNLHRLQERDEEERMRREEQALRDREAMNNAAIAAEEDILGGLSDALKGRDLSPAEQRLLLPISGLAPSFEVGSSDAARYLQSSQVDLKKTVDELKKIGNLSEKQLKELEKLVSKPVVQRVR